MDFGLRENVRADEKLTAFLKLDSVLRKNSIDVVCARLAELHSHQVRWAPQQELHLTLFPQGQPVSERLRSQNRPINQMLPEFLFLKDF